MSHSPFSDHDSKRDASLPEWRDCDAFCISAYSGNAGARCGWRGRLATVACTHGRRLCPRCGGATLLPIPEHPSEGPTRTAQ